MPTNLANSLLQSHFQNRYRPSPQLRHWHQLRVQNIAQVVYCCLDHRGSDLAFSKANTNGLFTFTYFDAHTFKASVCLIFEPVNDSEDLFSVVSSGTRLLLFKRAGLVSSI